MSISCESVNAIMAGLGIADDDKTYYENSIRDNTNIPACLVVGPAVHPEDGNSVPLDQNDIKTIIDFLKLTVATTKSGDTKSCCVFMPTRHFDRADDRASIIRELVGAGATVTAFGANMSIATFGLKIIRVTVVEGWAKSIGYVDLAHDELPKRTRTKTETTDSESDSSKVVEVDNVNVIDGKTVSVECGDGGRFTLKFDSVDAMAFTAANMTDAPPVKATLERNRKNLRSNVVDDDAESSVYESESAGGSESEDPPREDDNDSSFEDYEGGGFSQELNW